MTKRLIFILKLAFSIGVIVFVFYYYININYLIKTIQNINYLILPFLIILFCIIRLLLAYQTKISLVPFNIQINTFNIFKIHLITSFYSLILPGELLTGGVTWYLLSKDNGKRAEVASVLVYLRILNIITLIPFALLGIYFEPRLKEYDVQFYIFIFGFLLLIMLLPFFWSKLAFFIEFIFNYIISLIPLKRISKRLLEANRNVWHSVRINQEMPIHFVVKIVILSFFCQLLSIIALYFLLEMVNIHLSFSVVSWLLALLVIISFIPLTIAGIGIRDLSLIFVLQEFYAISSESSLLLSTVILLVSTIFFGIWGGYYALTYQSKQTADQ
jgi:glycosyltransferase 2 family protein